MARRFALEKISRLYRDIAVIFLNTVLLLIVFNLIVAPFVSRARKSHKKPAQHAWLIEKYGFDRLAVAYPGWKRKDLRQFLVETSNWEDEYEPFTQFRQKPRHDRWITIDDNGFRPVPDQAPWPPSPDRYNVFVFGGSTTMGSGVPDDSTIPAFMSRGFSQCTRPIGIYNFGRGYYFSSQERALFEKLLIEGQKPALAVFIDGLNDFYYADGDPQWTPQLHAFMAARNAAAAQVRPAEAGLATTTLAFLQELPMGRLAGDIRGAAVPPKLAFPVVVKKHPLQKRSPAEAARAVIERWTANRKIVEAAGQATGVRTAWIWQPVPTYGYDLSYHHLYEGHMSMFGRHVLSATGYRLMAQRRQRMSLGKNFLWLADMQRGEHQNLYVDAVHYTAAFSSKIARRIDRFLIERGLVPCSG